MVIYKSKNFLSWSQGFLTVMYKVTSSDILGTLLIVKFSTHTYRPTESATIMIEP